VNLGEEFCVLALLLLGERWWRNRVMLLVEQVERSNFKFFGLKRARPVDKLWGGDILAPPPVSHCLQRSR
jgi:hypothetical protein